jgi:hypothetical protein
MEMGKGWGGEVNSYILVFFSVSQLWLFFITSQVGYHIYIERERERPTGYQFEYQSNTLGY